MQTMGHRKLFLHQSVFTENLCGCVNLLRKTWHTFSFGGTKKLIVTEKSVVAVTRWKTFLERDLLSIKTSLDTLDGI